MTGEKSTTIPDQTDLLFEQITDLFGESVNLAQIEITHLQRLRRQIVSLETYYIMLIIIKGQRSPHTLSAQGELSRRVREFATHLESLGLDANGLTTAAAIIALPFPDQS